MSRGVSTLPILLLWAAACAPVVEEEASDVFEECFDVFAGTICASDAEEPESNLSPARAIEGERRAVDGSQPLVIGTGEAWGEALRVDAAAGEHVAFRVEFTDQRAPVDLEILAWDRGSVRQVGITNWGRDFAGTGFRVLAAMDADGPRTFWARARARDGLDGATLAVTRTQIDAGPLCEEDCDRLLQLPLPLDPTRQGYALSIESVYAYQFGRRDLLMALFHAGRRLVAAGEQPFEVKRLSRWDAGTPPSHRSHAGGVDVDLSLYDADGTPVWQALCLNNGRRCLGRPWSFGARPMALLLASFFESRLFVPRGPAGMLIDRAYHRDLRAGADGLHEEGLITPEIHALFSRDQGLLRHVEPHHHHLHVRVGESPAGEVGD